MKTESQFGATVTLTWFEVLHASMVGIRRQIEALKKNLPDAHGFNGDESWTVHIEGACGEMALAKHRNLYWNASVNTFKKGADVLLLHVRTRSKPEYELIVRRDDPDQDVFVLVTGRCPTYKIHGWIHGKEAKKTEWLKEHGGRPPAFFVPQSKLRPFVLDLGI